MYRRLYIRYYTNILCDILYYRNSPITLHRILQYVSVIFFTLMYIWRDVNGKSTFVAFSFETRIFMKNCFGR